MRTQRGTKRLLALTAILLFASTARAQLKLTPGIAVSETYDDNVYLQDKGSLANDGSAVTTISPSFALGWMHQGDWNTDLEAKYVADFVTYHADPSETHDTHNLGLGFKGTSGVWSFDLESPVTVIDGSHTGLTFTSPGAVPAMGGIPLRDDRAQTVYKPDFKVQYTDGPWLVRPVFQGFFQDFATRQSSAAGYENYDDRADMNGGLDVGYKAILNTYLTVGYRYGWQGQATLLGSPVQYSNQYNRILLGAEGQPWKWLKLAVKIGPDFHNFTDAHPAPGFGNNDQAHLFLDTTITVMPTSSDDVCLYLKRFIQPNFCGGAIYEDITYQLTYRHTFTPKISVAVTLKDYGGDWEPPAIRTDRIYTAGVSLTYKFNDHFVGDIGYSYDYAVSQIPDTSGINYNRSLTSIDLRYLF
jgi:hypothetical protein